MVGKHSVPRIFLKLSFHLLKGTVAIFFLVVSKEIYRLGRLQQNEVTGNRSGGGVGSRAQLRW